MKAIIIIGPPGAGKGTQANLIALDYDIIHFDSGRYIERFFQQSENKRVKEEHEFNTGELTDPRWMLPIVKNQVEKIAKAKLGVVLSGSLRTVFEALGDTKHRGLVPHLVDLYGKSNLYIFSLEVPENISISRNSKRRVCSACNQPHKNNARRRCSFCGGALEKRILDKPRIIKNRLKNFKEQTRPVLYALKERGFKVYSIDGLGKPVDIFLSIRKHLK